MKWQDLRQKNDWEFKDKSKLTQIHDIHPMLTYEFTLKKHPRKSDGKLQVSEDHYILCNISKLTLQGLLFLQTNQPKSIPTLEDYHIIPQEDGTIEEYAEIIETEPTKVGRNKMWISARNIHYLLSTKEKIKPVGNKFTAWNYTGIKDCYCISTDTGKYELCGVTHHNSVTLRDVIFHSLTHGDEIKVALCDLKLSEFEGYKGLNNVLGVANSVRETAELLRLGREVMYSRNKQNAERGLTDFADYQPQIPTSTIRIFGREYDENDTFNVKINEDGEIKQMTAKEILEWQMVH